MFPKIWQKLKQNHLLMMAICCLAPIILVIVFLALFKGSNNYWLWLFFLFCLILHIWMMKKHNKHDNPNKHKLVENNKDKI